jgi:hypothetical protein
MELIVSNLTALISSDIGYFSFGLILNCCSGFILIFTASKIIPNNKIKATKIYAICYSILIIIATIMSFFLFIDGAIYGSLSYIILTHLAHIAGLWIAYFFVMKELKAAENTSALDVQ